MTVRDLHNGVGAERLAAVIRCDATSLLKSTPVISGGGLVVRGERISSKRESKRSVRRLFPRCMTDSAHHRFWYDLEFVSTCPKHAENLVHTCSCGRDLSWSDVSIAKCRRCKDGNVTRILETAASPDVLAMDRWALGRLGVGLSESVPVLDTMPLDTALHVIGMIGILDIKGYEESWPDSRDLVVPVAKVRSRGFRVMKDGRLDTVLDRVYEGFLSSRTHRPATIRNAYGWFRDWFPYLKPRSLANHLAEIVVANASRKFQLRERERRELTTEDAPASDAA